MFKRIEKLWKLTDPNDPTSIKVDGKFEKQPQKLATIVDLEEPLDEFTKNETDPN